MWFPIPSIFQHRHLLYSINYRSWLTLELRVSRQQRTEEELAKEFNLWPLLYLLLKSQPGPASTGGGRDSKHIAKEENNPEKGKQFMVRFWPQVDNISQGEGLPKKPRSSGWNPKWENGRKNNGKKREILRKRKKTKEIDNSAQKDKVGYLFLPLLLWLQKHYCPE